MDYREKGLDETLKVLDKNDIKYVGAGRNLREARSPKIIEKNGIKIGFLGYCYTYEATRHSAGTAPLWSSLIKEDIKSLKDKCHIVIVSLHFGEEFCNFPLSREVNLCRSLIDEGANVILGHHPHVIRGIERYNEGLIAYGLGNFIFDYIHLSDMRQDITLGREIEEKIWETMMLELDFEKNRLKDWQIHPLCLNDLGYPIIPPVETKRRILNNIKMYNESVELKNNSFIPNSNVYYTKRAKFFLRLFAKSLYKRNFVNIYLLIMRFFQGG